MLSTSGPAGVIMVNGEQDRSAPFAEIDVANLLKYKTNTVASTEYIQRASRDLFNVASVTLERNNNGRDASTAKAESAGDFDRTWWPSGALNSTLVWSIVYNRDPVKSSTLKLL